MSQRSSSPSSSTSSSPRTSQTLTLILMARKSSNSRHSLIISVLCLISLFAFFITFLTRTVTSNLDPSLPSLSSASLSSLRPSLTQQEVKIFMYDLPEKFTLGMIHQHAISRGTKNVDFSTLKYPGHQHMAEWYLFSDLNKPESERVNSEVIRVKDPEQADLFYVPVFSSLSLIVNPVRANSESDLSYSDEEMQEEFVEWLEGQEYWKRNFGRDHVIIAQDPNALSKVIPRLKNAMLLVSDFGRLKGDQASLVKDVILPYSHRIRPYDGDVGVENRNTLLFFMGNRYRKEGGKIRDVLFKILENEDDVIIKHGAQSRESRRAASQGMHSSKFCLHPAGDTPSACRLFDAIVSMCIPVIVSDNIELPFEDVINYQKIAVFVETPTALIPGRLVKLLRAVPTKRILEYQKELKKVKRYFMYDDPNGTVNEIWRQVSQKLPLIKLMINRDKRLVKNGVPEPNCSCVCTNQTGISTL